MLEIFNELEKLKPDTPINTYRTILGQIKAGDVAGAKVGIERIKRRLAKGERDVR